MIKRIKRMRRTKRGKDRGFTLLEVLLALGLVAVAAVGILVLNNDLLRLVGNTRSRDSLAMIAREVAYKHSAMSLRHPVLMEGECEPPDDGCRWSIRSESVKDEPGLALLRLTVDCGWGETVTIESAVTVFGVAR